MILVNVKEFIKLPYGTIYSYPDYHIMDGEKLLGIDESGNYDTDGLFMKCSDTGVVSDIYLSLESPVDIANGSIRDIFEDGEEFLVWDDEEVQSLIKILANRR